MQRVSGDLFSTSWATGTTTGNGGNITISGLNYGVVTWLDANDALLISHPGTQTNVTMTNFTACKGNCVNSIGYDTSLNPVGLNPILRATDGSTVSGKVVSSTSSGGDNDEGFNCTGRTDTSTACKNNTLYYLALTQGGCQYVEGIKFIGAIPQVVAPLPVVASGNTPSPCGPLTWSHQNPNVAYFMGSTGTGNDPVIYSVIYSWDGVTGHSPTFTAPVIVYDIGASSGVLPNGVNYGVNWSGPLTQDLNDQLFWIALSSVRGVDTGDDTITVNNGSGTFTLNGLGTATACSQSGTTVTVTSTYAPSLNVLVTLSGFTPSGYNGTFAVTTTTGSQFQFNTTSGLTPCTAFGTIAETLTTDGSSVNSLVTINGVANTYTIATVTGGGLSGTITPVWAGVNGTYSFAQISGQGSGKHVFAVKGTWSGSPGTSTFTGSGAALYDVFQGTIAASGTATGGSIDSACLGMHIHDSFGFRGSQYVQTSGASTGTNCGNTRIFWNALTLHTVPCTALISGDGSACQGHGAYGEHNIAVIGNPNLVAYAPPNANAGPFTSISTATGGCENHYTWQHGDPADSVPVVNGSANNNYSSSGSGSTWTFPYYNEIYAIPITGATPIRFTHTFSLGPGNGVGCGNSNVGPFDSYFNAQYSIGITSQDGRLWEWSSSMLGNLATDSPGGTRDDIFVVALDDQVNSTPVAPATPAIASIRGDNESIQEGTNLSCRRTRQTN